MSEFKEILTRIRNNEIAPAEAMNLIKETDIFVTKEKTSNYYFENCLIPKSCPQSEEKKSFGNLVVVCEKEEFAEYLRKEIDRRENKYSSLQWVKRVCRTGNVEIKTNIDTIIYIQPVCNKTDLQQKITECFYSFIMFLKSVAHLCKHTYLEYVSYEEKNEEPIFGSVIGFLRTFAKEQNLRGYKNIIIAREDKQKELATILLEEYENEGQDVLYDGMERSCYEVKRYFPQENTKHLKPGVYIIPGGCGGLGKIVANYMVNSGLYQLILIGRMDVNERIQNICQELSKNNCEVSYRKADICSEEDVKQLYGFVHKKYGQVTGVIHSAGVLSDKLVVNKTEDDYDTVLAVKIYGTVNLYKYLDKNAKMILFSSITSVTGNIGQSDYGYANEFMNKFAIEKNQLDGSHRIQSICWPLWENGGMQIEENRTKNIEKSVGSKLITNEDGLEAFQMAIGADASNIIVMNGRYEQIRKHLTEVNLVKHITTKKKDKKTDSISLEEMKTELSRFLMGAIASEAELDVKEITTQDNFETLGLNSIMNMNIINTIEEHICDVSKTLLYECHSIEELTDYMLKEYKSQCYLAFHHLAESEEDDEIMEEQSSLEAKKKAENTFKDDGIAIIGMAGTYPHSSNLEEFWYNIMAGNDCVDEIPASRWDFEDYYSKEKNVDGKSISKWGGFIDDYDKFDPLFFNISPRDAADIDPQERLMLQTAWHTFENAGYTKQDLDGSETGVYIGVMYAHYQYYGIGGRFHQHGVAMTNSSVSNRISHFMNFHGPCMSIDTMCSSSLTALDIACNDMKLGKIDSALVGGVNLSMHPNKYVILSQKHFLSSDGRCHSFEEGGDGYVPSEGVGAIYIKKLSKAKLDGDRILAVIRSTALNHGGHTSGFTVPNPESQGEVIKNALEQGGVNRKDITYLEAHGTGTAIGDPIEIKGLFKAFGGMEEKKHCAIGSLKSVFGHPESAAGIAAITKVILQMQNKIIPPSVVRRKVNENLELEHTPFYLVKEPIKWEPKGHRIAGISAFGAGGSNAHVILEEYSENSRLDVSKEDQKQLFVLSAKDEKQLKQKAYELARYFESKLEREELLQSVYEPDTVCSQLENKLRELLKLREEDFEKNTDWTDLGMDIYLVQLLNEYISRQYGVQYLGEEIFAVNNVQALSKDICQKKSQKSTQINYNQEFFAKAAISLALERESMTERLAFCADNMLKVIQTLDGYCQNEVITEKYIYTGNILKQRKHVNEIEHDIDIHYLINNRNYEEICRLWAMGYPVDFYEIHPKKTHISLPLYPFKKERYFVEDMAEKNEENMSCDAVPRTGAIQTLCRKFNTYDSFVKEHVVGGRNYLQGVACLELFHECVKETLGTNACISNVIWKRPIDLTNGAIDIKVDIKEKDRKMEIEAYSKVENNKTLYCVASISKKEGHLVSLNTKNITYDVTKQLSSNSFYQIFEKRGIQYGRELKGIQNVRYSDDSVIAYISFENQHSAKNNVVRVLDAAVQCGIVLIYGKDDGKDKYVPFSVDSMKFLGDIPSKAAIFIKRVGTIEDMLKNRLIMFDAVLTDGSEKILVEMKRFVCKPIHTRTETSENESQVKELMYYKEYVPAGIFKGKTNSWETMVIFTNQYFGEKTAEAANIWNKKIVTVVPAANFQKIRENVYAVNGRNEDEFTQLLKDARIQDNFCILYLWDLFSDDESIENTEYFFSLNRSLVKLNHIKNVGVIYSHKYRNVLSDAYGMAVDGFQRTIEREKRGFCYKYVCLNGNDEYSDILDLLYQEADAMNDKNVVYNKKDRQIAEFKKIIPSGIHDSLKQVEGTWIITGGLGGLGKIFAEFLSHKYHVNLVLTGSSYINEEKKAFMDSIRVGNEIEYVQCNIKNYKDVYQLIKHVKEKYHTITGVIQAAGIIKDSFLRIKTLEGFHQVADVKVKGIGNLYRALVNENLKYFITFSSIAGVIGNAGQCDYAFANAYVDNYVNLISSYMKDCKCISINWPYWEAGGMQVRENVVKNMYDLYGIQPLPTAAGIRLFENILSTEKKQVIVFYGVEDKVEEQLGIKKEVISDRTFVPKETGRIKDLVLTILSDELKIKRDEFDDEETFENYGVDSVLSVSIADRLSEIFSAVSKTILFECINISELCDYLERHSELLQGDYEVQDNSVETPMKENMEKDYVIAYDRSPLKEMVSDSDIAIVGLSGQYPMADNTEEFWNNLKEGRDCISVIPSERWDCELFYNKEKGIDGCTSSKWGGFLKDIDKFDPVFFKITPGEAAMMDPQERLFLQETYHAIEDAGYTVKKLRNNNVGVYVGAGSSKYEMLALEESIKEKLVLVNNMNSNIANRVSYYFDFHGPSIAVDTMCSSSITAIDMACKALRNHEIDFSIAGGVNLLLHPYKYLVLSLKEFLSTDGRCRGFGEGGDGYVPGEGIGVLVLKRLKDAVRERDHIYCVIKGSLLNHGGKTRGYSVPNSRSQAQLIETSLRKANIHTEEIDYIEMHGTGTSLGDPIEIDGVSKALGNQKPLCGKIPFGTVKSNIGHLEAAAGIAGITKVALQYKYNCLVPSIHTEQLNKNINLEQKDLKIQRNCETWSPIYKNSKEMPHISTVSSFGAGGSNGHVIMEEYVAKEENVFYELEDIDKVFVFSDLTKERLQKRVRSFYEYISMHIFDQTTLRNLSFTLKAGRDAMKERIVVIADSVGQLEEGLHSFLREGNTSKLIQMTRLSDSNFIQKATEWCNGLEMDWERECDLTTYRRISLPLYSFEKQRCWIDVSRPGETLKEYKNPSVSHAVLRSGRTEQSSEKSVYEYLCDLFERLSIISEPSDIIDRTFEEIGIDSVMIRKLNVEMGRDIKDLSPTVFFECNTMNLLTEYIMENHKDFVHEKLFSKQVEQQVIAEKTESKEERKASVENDDIAIIGISGKYPGAENVEKLWENLAAGKAEFRVIPSDRWDYRERFNRDMLSLPEGTTYCKWGAFIDDAYKFDARFFSIAPVEAEMMDPQERLFLECAWHTMEDAGYANAIYKSRNQNAHGMQIGVFVGETSNTYSMWGEVEWSNHSKSYPKTFPWSVANRVSYQFNLNGPSMAVDTACSSSLTAIHLACNSIQNGECTMAIAGGVNLYLHQGKYIHLCQTRMLSSKGTSNPFGNGADGFVPGEGVGAVMLKRKADAIADGDRIYAVIRSTAINHGGHTTGYTVPNPVMQSMVIEDALKKAGISPMEISHVEAHGTGTDLGDPIEINGLTKAFRTKTDKTNFCAVSSIKGNIGHAEAAAGIAGVTKILLEMEHNALVPNVYYGGLNPKITFANTPFYVQECLTEWKHNLCAAVSSFGAGGSNCNVIIEKYREDSQQCILKNEMYVIPVSAQTEDSLDGYLEKLLQWCQEHREEPNVLHNVSYTLQKRATMSYRRVFLSSSIMELQQMLKDVVSRPANQDNVIVGNYDNLPSNDKIQLEDWAMGERTELPDGYYLSDGTLLSLPFYVFQGRVYRFVSKVNNEADFVTSRRIPLPISAEDYYVKEHKVGGKSILPAACFLECTRMILDSNDELQDVVFGKEISDEEIRNGIYLERKKNSKYVLSSGTADRQVLCASGTYKKSQRVFDCKIDSTLFELESFKRACSQSVRIEQIYGFLKQAGIEYGEHMKCIKECYQSKGQVYAELYQPTTINAARNFLIEPCMLDSAFQLVALLLDKEDYENHITMLPYSVKEYNVYHRISQNAAAYVKRKKQNMADFISFDISIVNNDGMEAVRVLEYTVKKKMRYQKADIMQIKAEVNVNDSNLRNQVLHYVTAKVAEVLGYRTDEIKISEYLEVYGIDSVSILNITEKLEKEFGSISKTLFFEYKTIQEITNYFLENNFESCRKLFLDKKEIQQVETEPILVTEEPDLQELNIQEPVRAEDRENIAIIGMSGIFPGAKDLDEFWDNLCNGVNSITEIPADRWDGNEFYECDKNKKGAIYAKWGGFIHDIDKFDPLFFHISPRDAEIMDPQERIFLQCSWKAVEDAGYTKETLPGKKTSVYVGVMYGQYQLYGAEKSMKSSPMALNSSFSSIANRVSYILNLGGPSLAVDTMCSSSLTALHLACTSIANGESEMSIVGGVNLSLHKNKYTLLCHGKFLSSDGKCRSFGENGDGYVPGEGVGAIILKPLRKAEQDGDHILGVVRATAINHGGKTNGYTVPNPQAQASVVHDAIKAAGIKPNELSYIEAHGTGTALGDPIEILSMNNTYGKEFEEGQTCYLGSVKSNIGHLESAAGIAAIIKVLLQFKHKLIVPSLHSSVINQKIDIEKTPFYIPQKLEKWGQNQNSDGTRIPRMVGINSFGAGGSNAHAVLQEYEQEIHWKEQEQERVYVLSAFNEERLLEYAKLFLDYLKENRLVSMESLAYMLQVGREQMEKRVAILAVNQEELMNRIQRYLYNRVDENVLVNASSQKRMNEKTISNLVQYRMEELARLWVEGNSLIWMELYQGRVIPKISIPTYPFSKERYWVPSTVNETEVAQTTGNQAIIIRKNEYYVRDHKLSDVSMVPGVALLEMMRKEIGIDKLPVRMEQVAFQAFVQIDNKDVKLNMKVEKQSDDYYDAVLMNQNKEITARAKFDFSAIHIEKFQNRKESMPLDGIYLKKEKCYQFFDSLAIEYKESMQGIKEARLKNGNVYAILEKHAFPIARLDSILQAVMLEAYQETERHKYVPFSMEQIILLKPLEGETFVYVEPSKNAEEPQNMNFNIFVWDEKGELCIAIENYVVRKLMEPISNSEKKLDELLSHLKNGEIDIDEANEFLEDIL